MYNVPVTLRRVGKVISTVLHIVCVALGTRHAMRMRHIVICGLPRYKIFFPRYLTKGTVYKKVTEHKMCVLIFSTTFVCNIFLSKKNRGRYDKKCILVFM
jgi:hypothetical protein